ncbi:MAG: cyclic-di-AMP receptor [Clostridia bacterium]|nr:cyclic-di-AMP receptor [Clostridia bacterium]
MKLIVTVVNKEDTNVILEEMTALGHPVTLTESYGGFLQGENSTLFAAVEDNRVDDVLEIIGRYCHEARAVRHDRNPDRPIIVGSAVVFVTEIDLFTQF